MPKGFYTLNDFSGGLNSAMDPRDLAENEISEAENIVMDQRKSVRPLGGDTAHTDVGSGLVAGHITPGYGAFIFESDHEAGSSALDTGENWLAVMDSKNAQVDLYDKTGDAFNDNKIALGSITTDVAADVSQIDFPTTSTITDTQNGFVSAGFQKGDIIGITGCSSTTENNLNAVRVAKVTAGTITAQGTPFTVEASEAGTVTIHRLPLSVFYFADEALRVADASFGAAVQPYWYGYIKRAHFSGTTTADSYDDWYSKTNGLAAPEEMIVETGSTYPTAGDGFRIKITDGNAGTGTFETVAYQFAASFIYDDNQESLLYEPSSNHTHTPGLISLTGVTATAADPTVFTKTSHGLSTGDIVNLSNFNEMTEINGMTGTVTRLNANTFGVDGISADPAETTGGNVVKEVASCKLTVELRAVSPFDPRISGARIYVRKNGTDDPWALFTDISLKDGARMRISGDYNSWVDGASASTDAKVISMDILSPNIETYEILNGFSPDEKKISISGNGEGYKTAVIANRRCYVANVKTFNKDGIAMRMRDRIMYTPIGKFDTFPTSFFIDVVKGDAEEFVKLEEFSDRLLAFKNRKLYVINIASPSPASWYVENIKDFAGILHPYASVKTEFGICWINDFGLYMYDGQNITNLLFNKIKESDWQSFVTEDSLIGYNPRRYYLVVLKDAFANLGDVYVYDFRVQSFVSGKSAFDDDYNRSNMVVDWNGNMTTVYQTKYFGDLEWATAADWDGANNTWNATTDGYNIKEWSDTMRSIGEDEFKFTTRDIDFGDPGRKKKVYGLTLTYKSDTNQTQPIYYATDGSTSFSSQLTGNFASGSGWQKLRATVSTPIECQSIRFKVTNPSTATGVTDGIQINDLSVEYRPIYKRVS
jgi:hypothetical protein